MKNFYAGFGLIYMLQTSGHWAGHILAALNIDMIYGLDLRNAIAHGAAVLGLSVKATVKEASVVLYIHMIVNMTTLQTSL
jgi:hypothetical protein